ncbi:hypothetical protein [Pseudolactococcus hodotermopsidis]|uniref:hypothetical protein n=1 Tax=Pseudolactococcus hodotermopsidis TaxID=2709157 RepID=UPI0015573B86|nr:hypothetical protein [Lactococcus hodotermopsidis]
MNNKKKLKYMALTGAIILPYVLNAEGFIQVVSADVQENIVTEEGTKIKKYKTVDLADVPTDVLENPELYRFLEVLLQSSKTVETLDKLEAQGKLNYQEFIKAEEFIWSDKLKGKASASHHENLPSELVATHSELGLNTLNTLKTSYESQELEALIALENHSLKGEMSHLPDYVKANENPILNHNLQTKLGLRQFTTDKAFAQSQPNFAVEEPTILPDNTATPIPGKADADRVANGELLQLPDVTVKKANVSQKEYDVDKADEVAGRVTLGEVVKRETTKQETADLADAKLHDVYQLERYESFGAKTLIKPNGLLGIDFIELLERYIDEWDDENISNIKDESVNYVKKGSDDDQSLARYWETPQDERVNVTAETLQADLDAGLIIRDPEGNLVTKASDLTPYSTDKIIKPWIFDSENIFSDFPDDYETENSENDLKVGLHFKDTLASLPKEVRDLGEDVGYTKQVVYIKGLYDEYGKIIDGKLNGVKDVDWEYTHILEANGSPKLVTLANLYLPGDSLSLLEQGIPVVERQVYDYYEKKDGQYVLEPLRYLVVSKPKEIVGSRHELSTAQDSYNNGIGTIAKNGISSWSVLNEQNKTSFDQKVQNGIQYGAGAQGTTSGIDSWARSMNFRPVLDTAIDKQLEVDNVGSIGITGPGLYRTTAREYGLNNLNTPEGEIIGSYIFMELNPLLDANKQPIVDKSGNPVYKWTKYYYTDMTEYYALNKISAYDYGYSVEPLYSYVPSEVSYQTRQDYPLYQELAPIYSYFDNQYSYELISHAYVPTMTIENYSYREDELSWESYQLTVNQPYYREKLFTPWYAYDLPEVKEYSWQIPFEEPIPSDSETSDSETSESEASDSEVSDSETSESETSESEASESEASESEVSDSETSESEASESETSESEASESEASESEVSDSETSESEASESEVSDSETSESEASESEVSDSETSESETSESEASESEASDSETSESEASESEASESEVSDSETSESEVSDSEASESEVSESEVSESEVSESEASESEVSDSETSESEVSESEASESETSESEASESEVSESEASESEVSESEFISYSDFISESDYISDSTRIEEEPIIPDTDEEVIKNEQIAKLNDSDSLAVSRIGFLSVLASVATYFKKKKSKKY